MNNRDLQASVPIVVAAAIIQQEEKFLLTRRKPESDLGGLWEFPGGKKEPGETLRDCLRREVKEELGVEISEPQHFHSLRHQYPEKQVELHFFTCCIIKGYPQALDCAEIAWVYKHELISYEFPSADVPVLKKIIQSGCAEESVS
ncbi:MAG: 8-oxo-dGTP diphosphatase MutT [Nitrospirota bacterium]|jgi:8-oxo-dGTP diphosphatase|nr:8-oxo-dGTP diphosphatase MutT [Nitrospirota bacterium]MDH4360643.1 8-oxo-dGTP diphosphatase MutT [Nitrospirota bacterium]MDH5296134.1 8-oxo-dGTP diphosphatase MutT [Nitrospirota bacterium]MDH5576489.1 8-oxo-dGTP diphosphatase MutT [Nitrospirota bacterium]